ncbi:TPA: hypothetical protein ACMDT1_000244 [Vibrio parahaemolyticus]
MYFSTDSGKIFRLTEQ